jgi:hypothetical protein
MAFTYNPSSELGKVRMLIADTDAAHPIFDDAEVQAAMDMQNSNVLYVSGQAQPSGLGVQVPVSVGSIYRSAALLLRALASNKSRLSSVVQLLDVKLSPNLAAEALRDTAKEYIEMEQNSGAFAIAEMAPNEFSGRERLEKMFQRLYA